jgi:hypothetical protein
MTSMMDSGETPAGRSYAEYTGRPKDRRFVMTHEDIRISGPDIYNLDEAADAIDAAVRGTQDRIWSVAQALDFPFQRPYEPRTDSTERRQRRHQIEGRIQVIGDQNVTQYVATQLGPRFKELGIIIEGAKA